MLSFMLYSPEFAGAMAKSVLYAEVFTKTVIDLLENEHYLKYLFTYILTTIATIVMKKIWFKLENIRLL